MTVHVHNAHCFKPWLDICIYFFSDFHSAIVHNLIIVVVGQVKTRYIPLDSISPGLSQVYHTPLND